MSPFPHGWEDRVAGPLESVHSYARVRFDSRCSLPPGLETDFQQTGLHPLRTELSCSRLLSAPSSNIERTPIMRSNFLEMLSTSYQSHRIAIGIPAKAVGSSCFASFTHPISCARSTPLIAKHFRPKSAVRMASQSRGRDYAILHPLHTFQFREARRRVLILMRPSSQPIDQRQVDGSC
ncbi:hypothetical protein BD310DRAFT_593935 [Dichomitus squalens]|uniref:Uncharacterized protein n=1 Tax=Dichomitus squalens TaxID=114155 RepID=A0A4Q9PRB1_9APHY|nr:hypothetical protein BD310DRAFT_593935 [Dichomitus squalens]